jgi:hypothetical protein
VNTNKTITSGVLYNCASNGLLGNSNPIAPTMLATQLSGHILVQGHPVVFQQPTEPFTYLGVILTMTLNPYWKHQFRAASETLKQPARSLYHSKATAGQQMKIINTKIPPAFTYAFCVAPYTHMELKLLDNRLAQMTKRAYRQRQTSPTTMVHEDTNQFGMGCTSLLVDYTHACIQQLTGALNDTSRYGEIIRALLAHQTRLAGGMEEHEMITASRTMMRIRKSSALPQSTLVLPQLIYQLQV